MKKPPIAKRIAELKGEAAEKCSLTREEPVSAVEEKAITVCHCIRH